MTEPLTTETTASEVSDETTEAAQGPREARYRIERNEAREKLARANERIARMQRAEIERLASASLSHGEDLFSLSGNGVADYLNDDGDVDPEKIAADVAAILTERPGLRRLSTAIDRSQGFGAQPVPGPTDFSSLLRD